MTGSVGHYNLCADRTFRRLARSFLANADADGSVVQLKTLGTAVLVNRSVAVNQTQGCVNDRCLRRVHNDDKKEIFFSLEWGRSCYSTYNYNQKRDPLRVRSPEVENDFYKLDCSL